MSDLYTGMPDTAALRARLIGLKRQYGGRVKVFPIGRSALGREIVAAGIGEIRGATLFAGALGGQEWPVALLLTRFLEDLALSMKEGTPLAGIDVRRALAGRSVMVVPCLNPDGIELAAHGGESAGSLFAATDRLCGKDYRGWQANARGVDLRAAFDAGWTPVGSAAPAGFSGVRPMSEPECRAAANFCAAFGIRQLFVFSAGAREIAYRFSDSSPRARLIAQVLSGSCAAKVSERPGAAGFKDWFIRCFDRPAFEVGVGTAKDFDTLYSAMVEMMVLSLLI